MSPLERKKFNCTWKLKMEVKVLSRAESSWFMTKVEILKAVMVN